jgi:hypothetical protein
MTDKIFKYACSGVPLESWTIDSANKAPTGITIDPANVSNIWIVDSGTDRVYQYTGAAFRTRLSQGASATFALAPGNANPQGIADPPAPSSAPSTEQTRHTALPSDLAFAAMASDGGQSRRFTRRSESPFQAHDTDRVTPHLHRPASTTVDLGRTAARHWAPARRVSFDNIEGVVASVDSAFAELAVSATLRI